MEYFLYDYLSPQELAGFDRYKYKSVDTSPLANYVMHPFWNEVVKVVPLWIAPNLLTFVGWLFTLGNIAILAYYDWDFTAAYHVSVGFSTLPRYVWLFCAVSQFLSHTLDGIDGKQARRTQSSTPLGELFDHGLDSTAVWMMSISLLSCFGTQFHSHYEVFTLIVVISSGFFLAHWEKYNTSVLYLPWAYDFSQLGLTGVYLLTFLFSPDMWKLEIGYSLRISHLFIAISHSSLWILGLPVTIWHIIRARLKHPEFCPSVIEGLMPLVSFGILTSGCALWSIYSPTGILQRYPRMVYFAFGNVFSNITCRLIVAQMSSSKCERFNWLLYPFLFAISLSLLGVGNEKFLLYCFTILAALAQSHYALCVVNQLCDHLGIKCFKIKKHKSEANGR